MSVRIASLEMLAKARSREARRRLGQDAEEANAVATAESSIDSLQAAGLLYWASDHLGEQRKEEIADAHMRRVLEIDVRSDNSVIQSSTLDPQTGKVLRTHTHKGYSDVSTWGAVLYTLMRQWFVQGSRCGASMRCASLVDRPRPNGSCRILGL
ncbi:hypothetical protein [Bradyrhizobium japonicum]|uniref:hypothetical protein n=1 Tax=Bradyrhizobium japonicum TaxID=375 RepID=UPI002715133B|nr:hypothetical protein [Bradyrhizobium japonicum]WLB24551.1 hypothetical protein QIH95_50785 [Bradyrhizobium japonicum]